MSISFFIPSSTEPSFRVLLGSLGYDDLQSEEERHDNSRWSDRYWHFYRPGVSARSVEATYEGGQFQVRLLTPSAPDEFELAFRLIEAAAEQLDRPVVPEDDNPFPVKELRRRYPDSWVRRRIESGVMAVLYIVREEQQTVMLSGPVRPFYVGPRFLSEVEADGPSEAIAERFLDRLLQSQYIDPEVFFPAERMQALRDDGSEDPVTFAIWGPGVRYLFPDVQFLVLMGESPGRHVFIPAVVLPELAGDNFHWLDEVQCLVEAIDEDDWPALLDRARQYEVHPLGAAAGDDD
jgi:hypothetical protein